ncbi:ubiquitination network signaling protein acrB [Sarocladium implicatum]|nr:ubiquitination network signaling protein acrB [Sarocladium implicatum]
MPRASGSGKRHSGASAAHNNRHDNGLVGPAKRVTPRKSSSHIDPNGPSRSAADHGSGQGGPPSVPPLPDAAARSAANYDLSSSSHENRFNDAGRRSSVGAYSETSSDSGNFAVMGGQGGMNGGHRSIDVNATKNIDVHKDSGPLELVTTVLRSLPLQDTIAILIILMHIPSVSLTSIYALFAFITFVPPVPGGSAMNMNLWELWEAVSSAPSLITVACMDFAFFLFWAFLWPPLQDAILDMAKPIIALTLGGASGGRSASSSGFTACFGWVFFYHILRLTRSHWAPIVNQIPEPWRMPAIFRDPFDADYLYDKKSWIDLIKSGLAIHILMQGIVRGIKDWYLRRERATVATGGTDPEAGKSGSGASEVTGDTNSAPPDNETTAISNSNTTLKKKRKQSAHVRQQQPLWAALASTKIVFMKEYEFTSKSVASAGSNATDIHNLGNAPFDRHVGQIWIAHIGSDEVSFSTSHFPNYDDVEDEEDSTPSTPSTNGHALRPTSVNSNKPFYVRVNNAFWQPTRMVALDEDSDDPEEGARWTGDIYGLRPASKYVCEFVDSRTHETLFSTTVRTAQEALQEAESGSALPNGQPHQRPDSPSTTLRNSIAVSEGKLADEKSRLKGARKDWKTRSNALKKDNDQTDNQLSTAGSQDEKLKGKIRQQENQKSLFEQETERFVEEVRNFDTAPELQERKKKMERAYAAEKKVFDAAQKEFKDHKSRLDKDVSAKQVDNTNLNTRRNKTATRIAKVESELHNINDANNRGINEAERKKQERAQREEYQSGIETYYRERLNMVRGANTQRAEAVRASQTQVHNFHDLLSSANGMAVDMGDGLHGPFAQSSQQLGNWQMNPAAQPHFPSGMFGASSSDLMANAGAPAWHSTTLPPTAPSFEPRGFRSRGRSSSMLSDVSGFTQSTDGEDSPAVAVFSEVPRGWNMGRNRAGGSADSGSSQESGSGNGTNGSAGADPTSPR